MAGLSIRVVVVEQVETPAQMEERKKKAGPSHEFPL